MTRWPWSDAQDRALKLRWLRRGPATPIREFDRATAAYLSRTPQAVAIRRCTLRLVSE